MSVIEWRAPTQLALEQLIESSNKILSKKDIKIRISEDIFRIKALEMDWDIGLVIYEPRDPKQIFVGADGRKAGMFILHGGSGDFRSMHKLNHFLATKFGFRVVCMTYPGRFYFPDPSRDWPGETILDDGSLRTPIWLRGERIEPNQYDIIYDDSLRLRYGTRPVARAKKGTQFYDRMAAWPAAFEISMREACANQFPSNDYSIYVHGHSTGGPFVHMLTQRVENIAGVVGIENSPFGYMYREMGGIDWPNPFNDLIVRTWRDIARYRGAEALSKEGPNALMRLAWLMEDVHDDWNAEKNEPQFKAEYPIHYAQKNTLREAAMAAADRLKMNDAAREKLIDQYIGYTRELTGPGTKPVPPILLAICKHSRDHTEEVYRKVVIPMYEAMRPAPKVSVTRLATGTHFYEKREEGLPLGLIPPVAEIWYEAIKNGYFLTD